jgi:osmotically inducible lipoprotein OsmB
MVSFAGDGAMQKFVQVGVIVVALGALTACSGMNNTQQRALSGGAIGAAAGVGLTALTGGGNLLVGGALGAAGGAAIGAATAH